LFYERSAVWKLQNRRANHHPVKFADDLVLLVKEEKVLQDVTDELIETGRCYGTEMNMKKLK
jgi:hypothetical protein